MSNFEWVAAAVVAWLSIARLTRLFVKDSYPPVAWLRGKWDDLTYRQVPGTSRWDEGPWTLLFHCPYCFAPYVSVVVVLSGWASDWHTAWWLINGILAISYAAAVFVKNDGED